MIFASPLYYDENGSLGIILCMRPTNKRRRYIATSPLIDSLDPRRSDAGAVHRRAGVYSRADGEFRHSCGYI